MKKSVFILVCVLLSMRCYSQCPHAIVGNAISISYGLSIDSAEFGISKMNDQYWIDIQYQLMDSQYVRIRSKDSIKIYFSDEIIHSILPAPTESEYNPATKTTTVKIRCEIDKYQYSALMAFSILKIVIRYRGGEATFSASKKQAMEIQETARCILNN